jgi:hypothetical protein
MHAAPFQAPLLAAEALIAKPRIADLRDFDNGLLYLLDSFGLIPPSVLRRADSSHRHDARQHLIEVGIAILQRRKLCNGQHPPGDLSKLYY